MYLTGADLIDITIKQLEMLADILRADARSFASEREAASRDVRRCSEASHAIEILIPKLLAARVTQQPKGQMPLPGCANEDQM
jgi:hypothetical protein